VVGDGQGLLSASGFNPPQLDIATTLRYDLNPKIPKILTTSAPERTLSFDMHQRLKFKASQDGRIVG
jgi:hypothetical protein